MPKLTVFVLLVVAAFALPRLIRSTYVPPVGSIAPNFTLTSQNGQPVTLSQYRGKWVVLYLYPEDATAESSEVATFQRDRQKYEAANSVVLGVSAKLQPVPAGEQESTFELLADPEEKVTKSYGPVENFNLGTSAARSNFLIDPQGKIADEFVDLDPDRHSEKVLAELTKVEGK